MKQQANCLCGSVTLNVELTSHDVAACHCSMCVNWSGGPMLAVDCASNVEILDEANVTRFASSEWAERGFCKQCGTHLFYFLKPENQYHLPAGLLKTNEGLSLTHQIFIDEKPAFYEFKNETKNMTGAEVFAHFNGED